MRESAGDRAVVAAGALQLLAPGADRRLMRRVGLDDDVPHSPPEARDFSEGAGDVGEAGQGCAPGAPIAVSTIDIGASRHRDTPEHQKADEVRRPGGRLRSLEARSALPQPPAAQGQPRGFRPMGLEVRQMNDPISKCQQKSQHAQAQD